jgi:hypothetical protein
VAMRTSLGRHGRRNLPAVRRDTTDHAQAVASLQQTCPSWLVMWSRWRQTYTAFACFTAEPVIVDEAQEDAFLARLKAIEMASASGQDVRA